MTRLLQLRHHTAPQVCKRPGSTSRPARVVPLKALAGEDTVRSARAEVTRRIKELGRKGKPKEAINELTNLAKMGIQPDTQAATALVSACVANRNMEMAFNVFEELFTDFVEPDDIVFSILIRGHVHSNPPDWTAIAQLLSRMQGEFKLPMTVTVYNALLELCAASNDTVRATELIDKMASQGLEPNSYTERAVEQKRAMRSALRRTFTDLYSDGRSVTQ